MNITSLKGIEYFKSLKNLYCSNNKLNSLDVSANTALRTLDCSSNSLEKLDVTNNVSLETLYCYKNSISELDVRKNTSLTSLFCEENYLNYLDVRNNKKLYSLSCGKNQLLELDVRNNKELRSLSCFNNSIINLNVKNNTQLWNLQCYYTNIKTLDISNNSQLIKHFQNGQRGGGDPFGIDWTWYSTNPSSGRYLSINNDVKVKTKYEKVSAIFNDVPAGSWYVSAVQFVYDNDIMSGTNGGKSFSPNSNLTREQFTQVLYNNEGKPEVYIVNPFSDVKKGAWYTNSVLWAKENGIANGRKDGSFGVGNNITRQDLAMMLYAYAKYKNFDLSMNDNAIDGFTDKSKVQSYAKNAMNWAVTQGIMSGKGGGRLDPAGKATRAECASMIKKLLEKNE